MKKIITTILLTISTLLQLKAQSSEALQILLNKSVLQQDRNTAFLDQSKKISLPDDGLFLYSSLNNQNNFGKGYAANENYVMTISNPTHQKLRVRTEYIALDTQGDELRFFDGPDTLHPLLVSYKGLLLQNQLIVSNTENITIAFKSNQQNENRGFRLRVDQANLKGYKLATTTCLNSTPAADACVNAPLICNLNGYCGNTSGQYTPDNTNIPGFCGSIENNSWLSFIASSTSAQFEFISGGCQSSGSGIQALIYASTNCSNFSQVSNCVSQSNLSGSFTITTNTPLVPGSQYYIMVDGYAGNVCDYSVTAQSGVSINPQITSSQTQICPGGTVQLGSSVPSTSYSWTASDGTLLPNTATISVTPTITTTYTLQTGGSDCYPTGGTAVQTITVTNTLAAPNISAPNGACDNSNVTLTSLTNGGTYLWTGPNNFTATVQNPTINNFSSANVGTYSLVISYGSSCSTQQGTVNVTLLPSPTVAISASPSNAVCLGNDITLTATGAPSNSLNGYSWSWNSSEASVELESCVIVFGNVFCNPLLAIIPGTGSGPTAIVTPSANTQVCVSVTGSSGCIGKLCKNITVLSNTTLQVSPSVTTCPAQPVVLTANGASSYTWNPAASLSSANGSTVSANPATTTIYTVTGIGCNSVVVSNTIEVTVNNNPPFLSAIQSPSLVCPNQTDVTFSVTSISNTTYNWSLPPGAIVTSTTSTASQITANMGSTAGIYTIAVTATNTCGSATQTTTINVSQILVTASASSPTVCAFGTVTLTAGGAYWYNWLPATSLATSSGTMTNYNATPGSTTTYTVTGTLGACINTAVVTVSVITNTVSVTASPSAICPGQTVVLNATSSTATSYTWSNGVTQASTTVNPNSTTTYSIIGNSTCPERGFVTVTVNPNPVISINNPTICANKTATLTATGANTYTWSTGSNNNPIIVYPITTTSYSVIGSSVFGCKSSQNTIVTIYNPLAHFTGMPNSVETVGTILTLTNTSTGETSISWETCFATNIIASSITLPLLDTGVCCVKLIAIQGMCIDSTSQCVKIIPETKLIVPNVFTPNGDGKNDVFTLDASGIGEINFYVYNRWGTKLIEITGTGNIVWDGKTKGGALVTEGTYFYVVNAVALDDKKINLKGNINIFK